MKLDPRLQAIADYVKRGDAVADIGTDHAYVPVYLVARGICDRVVATDIGKGPLENARKVVRDRGYEGRIDLRLGNGLSPIATESFDKIIIAGMGGLLIRDLLAKHRSFIERIGARLILQPMVAQAELRQWLYENGFSIVSERLAMDRGKYYEILLAEPGKAVLRNSLHLEVGERLFAERDPLLGAFLRHKISKHAVVLGSIEKHARDQEELQEKKDWLNRRIGLLKEALDAYEKEISD